MYATGARLLSLLRVSEQGGAHGLVSRKYTSDYRLEDTLDPVSGRVITRSIYQGLWFRFCRDASVVRRATRSYIVLTALCIVIYVAALIPDSPAMRTAYVAVPFAAMAFALFYLAAGCRRLATAKQRVTREHKDKITERLRGASIAALVICAVVLIGSVVSWCLHGFAVKDLFCTLGAALIAAMNLVMLLRLHKDITMEQTDDAPEQQ